LIDDENMAILKSMVILVLKDEATATCHRENVLWLGPTVQMLSKRVILLRFPNVSSKNNSHGEIPLLKVWVPGLGFLSFSILDSIFLQSIIISLHE